MINIEKKCGYIQHTCSTSDVYSNEPLKRKASGFTLLNIHNMEGRTLYSEKLTLSTVNQSICNFSFRPSCNKNRSCQKPDQQHSAQSRSCRCCSCRIGSCPLGWDTCRWPFRHRTRCPCRRFRSPHQRSCRHWSLLQSCSGSCSHRQLEEV